MANTVRLKRSAVQGKAPVVGDLSLGELAVNTYDGKLYTKKNDGSDAIVEIGGDPSQWTTSGSDIYYNTGNVATTGTSTAASFIPTSSTVPTNGIYLPSANNVALATNGTGRLFIDSSGNVGVGTSSPASKLNLAYNGNTEAGIKINNTNLYPSSYFISASSGAIRSGGSAVRGVSINLNESSINTIGRVTAIEGTVNDGLSLDNRGGIIGVYGAAGLTSPHSTGHGYGVVGSSSDSNTNAFGVVATLNLAGNFAGKAALLAASTTGNDVAIFRTGSGEAARIDSSGRLLVGTSTSRGDGSTVQIVNDTANPLELFRGQDNAAGPTLILNKSRGSTASPTVVSDGDDVGTIVFRGYSGTASSYLGAARIEGQIDGTPDSGGDTTDMPGRLVFSTTADGASSPTERMRIHESGDITIGKSSRSITVAGIVLEASGLAGFTRSANPPGTFNRQTNDGVIINLLGQNVVEGTISVSGTTVSYNGAHLSRWSQLPGGATREEILRGTVLSNIDEMCEWGEEDNEQLNRMKVSDVEGDRNVSGVFQDWDDDDDTYTDDFYCAMTGDFIIRIAQGVTVERGDLLMSAGDGTAKPQDDDIIRSKTIAKVTSTHVTCIYEDGSYCVPCVLMAC